MLITVQEFQQELNLSPGERTVNLALIGMSNLGKSHWSQRLGEKYGYQVYPVDEMIAARPEFADKVAGFPGKDDVERMGHYLGMPYAVGYGEKERILLEAEGEVMQGLTGKKGLYDLPGSAIYHPEQMAAMKQNSLVILLDASPAHHQEMYEKYLAEPKPVCFNGGFQQRSGESEERALGRSYLELLDRRSGLYTAEADIILPYEIHKRCQTAEEFVEQIGNLLPRDQRALVCAQQQRLKLH